MKGRQIGENDESIENRPACGVSNQYPDKEFRAITDPELRDRFLEHKPLCGSCFPDRETSNAPEIVLIGRSTGDNHLHRPNELTPEEKRRRDLDAIAETVGVDEDDPAVLIEKITDRIGADRARVRRRLGADP